MALNTKTISAGVGDILNIDGGVDASSARQVLDGDGTGLPLYLTTTKLGVGESSPDGTLHITYSGITDTAPGLLVECTDANDATGPDIMIKRNSSSPDDGDYLGTLTFVGRNDNSQDVDYCDIYATLIDASDGSEDGLLTLRTVVAGAQNNTVNITGGKVGIGTSTPRTKLELGTFGGVPFAGNLAVGSDANHVAIALSEVSSGTEQYGIGVSTGGDLQFHDSSAGTITMHIEDVTGNVGIGETAPDSTLCVNQAGLDGEVMTFKSSDVAHGMTDFVETDTYARFQKTHSSNGGLYINGLAETGTQDALKLSGYTADEQSTRSTSALGFVNIIGGLKSSATVGVAGADKNLVSIRNYNLTRFIFDSDGSGHADVEWVAFSDSRLKSSVEDIPYGLSEVLQMQPKRFDKHSGDFDDDGNVVLEDEKRKMVGFMAQDIKAIIPEMVKDIDTTSSFYSMDDGKLVAVLVKAIQELSAKVTALESA